MKKRLYSTFALIALMFSASHLLAQSSFLVGKVMDEKEAPLPFVDVVLHDLDSTVVGVAASDENGRFRIDAEKGDYLLQLRMLSFETFWGKVRVDQPGPNRAGQFILATESESLEEVLVVGEKNQMELKLDKRVFNVGKDIQNVGGNATDILENLPSITVDIEGNVSLRGSENVRILINGKPSGLVGSDNSGLRQIQASMIERVEVITNPSARYEAEGEAGIINIVLKKQTKKGINGSIDADIGYPRQAGIGVNLNYRKDKFNLFTNLGARYREGPGGGESTQIQYANGDTSIFNTDRKHVRAPRSTTFQFGGDYFIDNKTTLTLSGTYRYSDANNDTDLEYEDFASPTEISGITLRENRENEIGHDLESNLNFKRTFTSKEHYLDININYQVNDDTEISDIHQEVIQGLGVNLDQRSTNVEDQMMTIIQADYVHPFGEKMKIETGWRTSLRDVDNIFLVEELDEDEVWQTLDIFDNEMEYLENIHAGYFIFAQEVDKWSYQVGLRAEYSDISTELIKTNEVNPRNYFNWFPSFNLSYNVSQKDQLQLSYSRRITRPRFRHLLPFYGYSDNRNIYRGNPDLDPEFSQNFDVAYLKYFEKGSILSSIYYRYKTDIIQRVTLIDDNNIGERLPVNIGQEQAFGLEFSLNYNLLSWLRINGNINAFQSITEGEYQGENLDAEALTASTRWTVRATIAKSWDVQTTASYMAPRVTPQGERKGMFGWDFGFSKEVLNKKGTITFNIRDVLNTRFWESTTRGETFEREGRFQWRVRSFTLGFNYLINQDKRRGGSRRSHEGSGGDGEGF
jgi:outer membrane receptor protein involved in Fe transport